MFGVKSGLTIDGRKLRGQEDSPTPTCKSKLTKEKKHSKHSKPFKTLKTFQDVPKRSKTFQKIPKRSKTFKTAEKLRGRIFMILGANRLCRRELFFSIFFEWTNAQTNPRERFWKHFEKFSICFQTGCFNVFVNNCCSIESAVHKPQCSISLTLKQLKPALHRS